MRQRVTVVPSTSRYFFKYLRLEYTSVCIVRLTGYPGVQAPRKLFYRLPTKVCGTRFDKVLSDGNNSLVRPRDAE